MVLFDDVITDDCGRRRWNIIGNISMCVGSFDLFSLVDISPMAACRHFAVIIIGRWCRHFITLMCKDVLSNIFDEFSFFEWCRPCVALINITLFSRWWHFLRWRHFDEGRTFHYFHFAIFFSTLGRISLIEDADDVAIMPTLFSFSEHAVAVITAGAISFHFIIFTLLSFLYADDYYWCTFIFMMKHYFADYYFRLMWADDALIDDIIFFTKY